MRGILSKLQRLAAVTLAILGPLSALAAAAQTAGTSGGTFKLIDQQGKTFSSRQLEGRPYAIFFGFTYCPDVCPTTLQQMSGHLKALGPDADKLQVVFVTVDPERDTPDVLRSYLSSFDPRILGLTGTPDQIAAAAKGWNAFYERQPEKDGSYSMVHSSYVYLMNKDNRLVDRMDFTEPEPKQLAKLRSLARNELD